MSDNNTPKKTIQQLVDRNVRRFILIQEEQTRQGSGAVPTAGNLLSELQIRRGVPASPLNDH